VQRFFKMLCISLKVPTVVAEAKDALENGHCVVIGLQVGWLLHFFFQIFELPSAPQRRGARVGSS
jgi:hypothetical protein